MKPRARLRAIRERLEKILAEKARAMARARDQDRADGVKCVLSIWKRCECARCVVDRRYSRELGELARERQQARQALEEEELGALKQLDSHRWVGKPKCDEKLIRRVLARGLTDEESAGELGVSRRTVSNYKKKYAHP